MDLVDEQDGHLALRERVDHHLEALFEVAAEARAGEQRPGIEREHLGPLEQIGDVVLQQTGREPFRDRGLADAGVPNEDRIVLAPPAEDLHRPVQFVDPADERIELAVPGARGEVGGVGSQRIALGGAAALTLPRFRIGRTGRLSRSGVRRRHLGESVREVLGEVQDAHALCPQQLSRVGLRLLQRGDQDVARVHFLTAGALDLQHRALEHPAEGQRLLGLLRLPRELLDAIVQVTVEILAQLRQIGAAGDQDPLAVLVVGQHVEQMLDREMGVPA